MDSIDDFEMKPITEGLGFHKEPIQLKKHKFNLTENEKSNRMSNDLLSIQELDHKPQTEEESLQKSLDKLLDQLNKPISGHGSDSRNINWDLDNHRNKNIELNLKTPLNDKSQEILLKAPIPDITIKKEPINNTTVPKIDKKHDTVSRSGTNNPSPALVETTFSVSAFILDGLAVLSFSMLFISAMLLITKIELLTILENLKFDIISQIAFASLYTSVWFMYVLATRSFFSQTLGEWTFDLQVGDKKQLEQSSYPIKVFFRTILVVVTGVVLLPFLSVIFRRDLTGKIIGLPIYKKV